MLHTRLKHTFIFILGIAVITGCLPEALEVDNVPRPAPSVVVGSQNVPDEFLVVSITKNFDALSGGPESDVDSLIQTLLIDSLEVTVTVDGTDYVLENPEAGLYVGTDVPEQVGATYTLNFDSPFNSRPVTASSELLPFLGFDSLGTYLTANEYDTIINIDMRIDDPPGPNWYMVNVQRISEEDYDILRRPFTELIEDTEFDGQLHDYSFRAFWRDYVPGDTVMVSMANISEDYYEFLRLRNEQRYNLIELFEPINYPGNINNGLGFFHTHIPDVRIIIAE